MKCNNCNTENVEGVNFCQQCGAPLRPQNVITRHSKVSLKEDKSGKIIVIWAALTMMMFVLSWLDGFICQHLFGNWKISFIVTAVLAILMAIVNYAPIFCIKNKALKIIGFIIVSILLILVIINEIYLLSTIPHI